MRSWFRITTELAVSAKMRIISYPEAIRGSVVPSDVGMLQPAGSLGLDGMSADSGGLIITSAAKEPTLGPSRLAHS